MRRFVLNRLIDISGVSGTGLVAEGIEFTNGKCAVTWLVGTSSVAVYDNMNDVEAIHGHGGNTEIIFIDIERKDDPVKS